MSVGPLLMMGACGDGTSSLLYDAMAAESPLGLWNFTEASGQFLDNSGGSDDTSTVGTTTTYRNTTGPDGQSRATFSASGASQGWVIASPTSDLVTFPLSFVAAYATPPSNVGNGMWGFHNVSSGNRVYTLQFDGSTYVYVWVGRTTGAAYRFWRYSVSAATWSGVGLISLAVTDIDTEPTLKLNGSTQTLESSFGPSGTAETPTGVYLLGMRAASAACAGMGPFAIYSGTSVDLASIESAANTEGWY